MEDVNDNTTSTMARTRLNDLKQRIFRVLSRHLRLPDVQVLDLNLPNDILNQLMDTIEHRSLVWTSWQTTQIPNHFKKLAEYRTKRIYFAKLYTFTHHRTWKETFRQTSLHNQKTSMQALQHCSRCFHTFKINVQFCKDLAAGGQNVSMHLLRELGGTVPFCGPMETTGLLLLCPNLLLFWRSHVKSKLNLPELMTKSWRSALSLTSTYTTIFKTFTTTNMRKYFQLWRRYWIYNPWRKARWWKCSYKGFERVQAIKRHFMHWEFNPMLHEIWQSCM